MTHELTPQPQRELLAMYWELRQVLHHGATCSCCWCLLLERAHRLATEPVLLTGPGDALTPADAIDVGPVAHGLSADAHPFKFGTLN